MEQRTISFGRFVITDHLSTHLKQMGLANKTNSISNSLNLLKTKLKTLNWQLTCNTPKHKEMAGLENLK